MSKYKKGDRVRHERYGDGVVVLRDPSDGMYVVDFGESFPGHDCGGHIHTDTGRWCYECTLTLVPGPSPDLTTRIEALEKKVADLVGTPQVTPQVTPYGFEPQFLDKVRMKDGREGYVIGEARGRLFIGWGIAVEESKPVSPQDLTLISRHEQ